MATEKTYLVQLVHGFPVARRITAGIVVPNRGLNGTDGYTGPLTDEQLAAIKADRYMTVVEIKPSKKAE